MLGVIKYGYSLTGKRLKPYIEEEKVFGWTLSADNFAVFQLYIRVQCNPSGVSSLSGRKGIERFTCSSYMMNPWMFN